MNWKYVRKLFPLVVLCVVAYPVYEIFKTTQHKEIMQAAIPESLPFCEMDAGCSGKTPGKQFDYTVKAMEINEFLKDHPDLQPGGTWIPDDCREPGGEGSGTPPRTAVIVPFMDRETHLYNFVQNVIRFLKAQQKSFTIFLLQQVGQQLFNKALMMNIGFLEAKKLANYSCFIFHDIDMVPVNLCNKYECFPDKVGHLGISRNLTHPHIFYPGGLTGVVTVTDKTFERINGFSNIFFGWGGEDDNAQQRLKLENVSFYRPEPHIGNYYHQKHIGNQRTAPVRNLKHSIAVAKYQKLDGVNTAIYKMHAVLKEPLFTRLIASFSGPTNNDEAQIHFQKQNFLFKIFAEGFNFPWVHKKDT